MFGAGLATVTAYAEILATLGVTAGVIGPREGDRLWARHLLNSVAVANLLPPQATVADVGSGAGLPGIPLAIARPDLEIVLVEPLLRRCTFLAEVIARLDLAPQVRVVRGRAPDVAAEWDRLADVVVARAVAPLGRLIGWTLPLVVPGGQLVALRGRSAEAEVAEIRPSLASLSGSDIQTHLCAIGKLLPVSAVVVTRSRQASRPTGRGVRRRKPGQ
jgi:16S rRNA (guanine527-N7)-methyltransferase